jgi:hypothetical protein
MSDFLFSLTLLENFPLSSCVNGYVAGDRSIAELGFISMAEGVTPESGD